jgi:peptidoglycan/LPS O-acetylase OafA/YrhL
VTLHSLAAGYLIWSLTLTRRGLLFHITNHPILIGLGILSYSLYLWQEPFLSYASTYDPAWWQKFPQNVGLALAVAAISYFVIERPILQLKKYLKPAPLTGCVRVSATGKSRARSVPTE